MTDTQELNEEITVKEYSSLDELFEGYDSDYTGEKYDFGEDVGLEVISHENLKFKPL